MNTFRRRLAEASASLALMGTVAGGTSWAQPSIVTPVSAGDCAVIVQFPTPPASGTDVELRLNAPGPFKKVAAAGRTTFAIGLRGPLEANDVLAARAVVGGSEGPWSALVSVAASTAGPQCPVETVPVDTADDREALEVSAYLGRAYDNFAPGDVAGYREGTASSESWRYVAGFDFGFRVWGKPGDRVQVWLTGESLHGVRSADIDCRPDPNAPTAKLPALCDDAASDTDKFKETLRHASSLEAYLAPRVEFASLQKGDAFGAKVYATMRLGAMVLQDAPEAFRAHHLGAGILTTRGPFEGSYLEAGWGKTELFLPNDGKPKWNRMKLDAMVSFPLFGIFLDRAKNWARAPRMFAQMYADFDRHDGAADSIQTFVGIDFNLSK